MPRSGIARSYQSVSSVTQSCPALCNPMNCSRPGLPIHHQLPESTKKPYALSWWCHPTISSSVIPFFSSIRVFPNESALCIRWPKYWSFSFSICPSNEYSGLISYRIDWFDSRIEPTSPALQADFLLSEPPGKPLLLLKLSCTCTIKPK